MATKKTTSEKVSAEMRKRFDLAKQARKEIAAYGQAITPCPLCGEFPTEWITEHGERDIVACKCGYIYNFEIY